MSVVRRKGGDNFGLKAKVTGASMEDQLQALNNMYRGSVEFCIGENYNGFDERKVICIKWTADNVGLLQLPECEHFCTDVLFSSDYKGKLRILVLPKCIKLVDCFYLDRRAKKLHRLVLRQETGLMLDNVPYNVFVERWDGVYWQWWEWRKLHLIHR